MRINNSIPVLNAYRHLKMNNRRFDNILERVSSGLRINRAADDSAGLAISEKMRAQVYGLNQAMRNAQDGISLIQTAEGALNETHSILQRMRELSVQAASDTLTAGDRMEIQKEIDQLANEVDRIAGNTEFNTKKLLDGTTSALTSTDNLKTKVFLRDGLRVADQFGQQVVAEGNYNIEIEADPGIGQVLKTDIMKVADVNFPGQSIYNNVLLNSHTGYAAYYFEVGGSGTGDIAFTLSIGDDTANVTVTGVDTTDNPAETIAEQLNSDPIFSAIGRADAMENRLFIDALGKIDSDYSTATLNWNSPGGQIVLEGHGENTSSGEITIDPATQNVTGIAGLEVNNFAPGVHYVLLWEPQDHHPWYHPEHVYDPWEGSYTYSQSGNDLLPSYKVVTRNNYSQSIALEVLSIDSTQNQVTFEVKYHSMDKFGSLISGEKTLTLKVDSYDEDEVVIGQGSFVFYFTEIQNFTIGDRITFFNRADLAQEDGSFTVQFWMRPMELDPPHEEYSAPVLTNYVLSKPEVYGKTINFKYYHLDEEGILYEADLDLTFASEGMLQRETWDMLVEESPEEDNYRVRDVAGLSVAQFVIGKSNVATETMKLSEIDRFYDNSDNFILQSPQILFLTMDNGNQTALTLYGSDTIEDLKNKLNQAIDDGLNQKEYTAGQFSTPEYVRYISGIEAHSNQGGLFSVPGTFVIQTALPGSEGMIQFSGDENLLRALSLTTIREAEESAYTIRITDAHSKKPVVENVKVSGSDLPGILHPNVDITFDPMANIALTYSEGLFEWRRDENTYSTSIHLSDNTLIFHVGANPLQSIQAAIGDMGAEAIGVDNLSVLTRVSANTAITRVDQAIERVSAERSKIGAVQNRLEHTLNNLAVASENLISAESRIRDLDFAAEMSELTRIQIMIQASSAIMGHANLKHQAILGLIA